MYICLHVQYPLLLSEFNELEFSRQIFEKFPNIKFHENLFRGNWVTPCAGTDKQADMTKPRATLLNLANAPTDEVLYSGSIFLNLDIFTSLKSLILIESRSWSSVWKRSLFRNMVLFLAYYMWNVWWTKWQWGVTFSELIDIFLSGSFEQSSLLIFSSS
jgi:hypothetical protein